MENEAMLSSATVASLLNFRFECPWVSTMAETIENALLSNGLVMTKMGDQIFKKPRFSAPENGESTTAGNMDASLLETELQKHWTRFARDVLEHIFAVGIVPVKHVKVDMGYDDEITIPVVVKGVYSIGIKYDDKKGRNEYKFYKNNKMGQMDNVDKNVEILDGFGFDPSINEALPQQATDAIFKESTRGGSDKDRLQIHSHYATIAPRWQNVRELESLYKFSTMLEANSPVFTQRDVNTEAKPVEETTLERSLLEGAEQAFERNVTLNEADISALQRQKEIMNDSASDYTDHINALKKTIARLRDSLGDKAKDLVKIGPLVAPPPIISLNAGHTLVANPHARNQNSYRNVQELLTDFQKEACNVFGIPHTVMLESSKITAGVDSHLKTYYRTLGRWRNQLGDIMSAEYHKINILQARPNEISPAFMPKWEELMSIRIEIPTSIEVTREDLWKLYLQGTISFEVYSECSLRESGLDTRKRKSEAAFPRKAKEPWSHEEKFLLLGGKSPQQPKEKEKEGGKTKKTKKQKTEKKEEEEEEKKDQGETKKKKKSDSSEKQEKKSEK